MSISLSAVLFSFPSTLILREWAALKTHDSLYNNGMSRYKNVALFKFKLKLMRMNWGLSIPGFYPSSLKKKITHHSYHIKIGYSLPLATTLWSVLSGRCRKPTSGPGKALAFAQQMYPLCFTGPRFLSRKSQSKSHWSSVQFILLNHLCTSENLH